MKNLTQILDKNETEFYKGIAMNEHAKQVMSTFIKTVIAALAICVTTIMLGHWFW
jgi:hypothetical protein